MKKYQEQLMEKLKKTDTAKVVIVWPVRSGKSRFYEMLKLAQTYDVWKK